MQYSEFLPPDSLSQIVRYFWVIDHPDENEITCKYRLLAESSPSLVFFPFIGQGILAGHTFRAQEFSITGKFLMIGACLYPYSIPMLYKTPAYSFCDGYVAFKELEYFIAPSMCAQMNEAPTHHARIKILSDYLLAKAKGAGIVTRSIQECVQSIVHSHGKLSVDYIANQLGLSPRQTERNFKQQVGCSPKQFSRLLRFHASLKYALYSNNISLTDVGYHCGYADQSHFIREFREFSGMSPKQYFRLQRHHRADNFVMVG